MFNGSKLGWSREQAFPRGCRSTIACSGALKFFQIDHTEEMETRVELRLHGIRLPPSRVSRG